MGYARKTKWIVGIAAACAVALIAAPFYAYEHVTREMWRRPYLDWQRIAWAPDFVNEHRGGVNAIGAERRWTERTADDLEAVFRIDLREYSATPTVAEMSERYMMAEFVVVDAVYMLADRLRRGPLDDGPLRTRLEEMLLSMLDHEHIEIRASAVGAVVDSGLVRRPEVHAQLLVMQHADTSEKVRNIARIQLEHDAYAQDLERMGKISSERPRWLRRR